MRRRRERGRGAKTQRCRGAATNAKTQRREDARGDVEHMHPRRINPAVHFSKWRERHPFPKTCKAHHAIHGICQSAPSDLSLGGGGAAVFFQRRDSKTQTQRRKDAKTQRRKGAPINFPIYGKSGNTPNLSARSLAYINPYPRTS